MTIPTGRAEGVRFGYRDLNLGRSDEQGGIQRGDPAYAEVIRRVQVAQGFASPNCENCGASLEGKNHYGRSRRYCSSACAQAHQGKTPITISPNGRPKKKAGA